LSRDFNNNFVINFSIRISHQNLGACDTPQYNVDYGKGRSVMNDLELVAIVKALDSEVVKNFLSPIARELGLTLGTCGEIFRFYSEVNLGKVFTKWAESRRASSSPALNAGDFEKIMPLLLLAATASDDELQTRWAALLDSAVADTQGFLPSFGRTLSELTAEEARYLDRLWKNLSAPTGYLSAHRPGREPLSYITLLMTFDPSINTGMNAGEWKVFKDMMTDEQRANYARLGHAELVIQDLERLGILTHEPIAEPDRFLPVGDKKIPFGRSQTTIRSEYSFTAYGVSFFRAVTTGTEKKES
jgi:hypothetical protein